MCLSEEIAHQVTKTVAPAGSTKSVRITTGCGTKSIRVATGYGIKSASVATGQSAKCAPVATSRDTKSACMATGHGSKFHMASDGGTSTKALPDLENIFESGGKCIWFYYVKVY